MTDLEFEKLLHSAVLEACRRDFAQIMDDEDLKFEFSPRYLRWEAKFLADPAGYGKKRARPVWRRVLRMGLCAVLVLALTFGAVLAVSPAARQWVVEWFETHTVFTFEGKNDNSRKLGNWHPGYLPNHSEIVEEDNNGIRASVVFEDEFGAKTYLQYALQEDSSFDIDNEHQEYSEVILSTGSSAVIVNANSEDEYNRLIWTDFLTGTAFKLRSAYSISELVKIAESMEELVP